MIGSHHQMPEEEEVWLRTLSSWKPAAVILASRVHSNATTALLRDMAVPVAEIWDLTTKPIDLAIGFSHFDNGLEMARCMNAAGQRKIGCVGALGNHNTSGHLRCQGFKSGRAELRLTLWVEENLQDQPGFYAGYHGTETMLARNSDLDAIYYHDDEMATGGLAHLSRSGLSVPDDVSVAGWGGIEAASILPRRLTTTAIPPPALARSRPRPSSAVCAATRFRMSRSSRPASSPVRRFGSRRNLQKNSASKPSMASSRFLQRNRVKP